MQVLCEKLHGQSIVGALQTEFPIQLSVGTGFQDGKIMSIRYVLRSSRQQAQPWGGIVKKHIEIRGETSMTAIFPSEEWLKGLEEKLNSDARYREIAKTWEGDLFFYIEPEGNLKERLTFYLDLWHGTCRKIEYNPSVEAHPNPTFNLSAAYKDITSILTGKLNPMTAMMTSKLKVKGSMSYMMRNVPTILDFVRVAQEATSEIM
jgi:putative sterol carrier protein